MAIIDESIEKYNPQLASSLQGSISDEMTDKPDHTRRVINNGIVIGKKATESGVEIYHDGRFVAILTADEIEGLYKSIKHAHIETLKG